MKFYTAGAVAHDPECGEWRERLENKLPMHQFVNPLKREVERAGRSYRQELEQLRRRADRGDISALSKIKEIMWSDIIPPDLEGLDECDALICYVQKGKRIWGSVVEIYTVFALQKKPVYLISELSFLEMNNWEIAHSTMIFQSVDAAVFYLSQLTQED